MIMTDEKFLTAEEFLDFFLKDPWFRTSNKYHATEEGRATMLFRGQSNATWGLRPSAFRDNDPLADFTPQPPSSDLAAKNPRMALGIHLHAEARAVFLFLDSADRLGIPTPLDFTTLNESNDLMHALMNDREYNYSEPFPSKKYEASVALAQHNGVPTRLLDWTESPLVACYFAAYGASVFAGQPAEKEQEIAVYFFTKNSASKDTSPVSLVKVPKHQNAHIRAQQGIFTNLNNANQYFVDHGSWPDLLDLANRKFQVQRRTLPASESNVLLRLLFDLDITRERLMPSLSNAALSYHYRKGLFDNV